jgi:hypothetical protein
LGRIILGLPTSFPCGARKQVIDNRRRYLQFAVLPHAFSIATGRWMTSRLHVSGRPWLVAIVTLRGDAQENSINAMDD